MTPEAAVLAMNSAARSLRSLSRVPAQIAKEASLSLVIRGQQNNETDPYGRPWKPLASSTVKRKRGDTRILRDSDRMLDDMRVAPLSGAGLSITFGRPQAAFHQIGTVNMPARQILPVADLPVPWKEALEEASERVFSRWAEEAKS